MRQAKATLINMLRQAENLGESSGVDVLSNVPCRILEGVSWKLILQNTAGTIFFIDEENAFINTEEFAVGSTWLRQLFCIDHQRKSL